MGFLLILCGLVNVFWPQVAWELTSGWKYKDAEPGDETFGIIRMCGGITVFLGIVMLFE